MSLYKHIVEFSASGVETNLWFTTQLISTTSTKYSDYSAMLADYDNVTEFTTISPTVGETISGFDDWIGSSTTATFEGLVYSKTAITLNVMQKASSGTAWTEGSYNIAGSDAYISKETVEEVVTMLSADLSTLEGWEDLPPGDNQISLQAMGAGYKDSDISEEVTVFKPYSIKPGDYRFISSPAAPTGFTELPITFITNKISVSKITFNNGNILYAFPSPLGTTQVYMANTNSWTLPAYRTIRITEEHTISKEQYDWFFANANRVYLIDAGTYTFRDYPHAQNMAQNINFTSNNTAYTVMAVGFTSDDVGGIYYRNSSSDTAYTRKSGWQQPFQTIVTSAVQEVTAEFYNWWNASI